MLDLHDILISQYRASLAMLKQAIVACPAWLWNAPEDKNKFWNVAYHALFFTHAYLEDSEGNFIPWERHRPASEDFEPPEPVEPYTQEEILEYLDFCERRVIERVPQLNFEGHFDGRPYNNFELQIYSMRHIMQHTGELLERLAAHTDAVVEWVGSKYSIAER
jgi:hypothetical protein